MNRKIYVGNIPYAFQKENMVTLFEQFGKVENAYVIKDVESGRSKGYGFVEMAEEAAALKAIEEMNGKEVEGRILKTCNANPIKDDVKAAREERIAVKKATFRRDRTRSTTSLSEAPAAR